MYMLQAPKVGYKRYRMAHVWWGKGDRVETPADVQTCQWDPIAHVQRFFLPKVQNQMTVISLDDFTDVLLMYVREGIKGSVYKTGALSGSGSWFISAVWLVPQLVHPASHIPSTLATSLPLEEWNYNQIGKCSLFVQPYVLKVTLGILSWCDLVVCKLVR